MIVQVLWESTCSRKLAKIIRKEDLGLDFFFDPAIPGCKSTYIISGWCFGTCFQFFPSIGNVIIPTDFHIFPRGGSKPPTSRSFSTGASLSSLFLYVKPRAMFPPISWHPMAFRMFHCHAMFYQRCFTYAAGWCPSSESRSLLVQISPMSLWFMGDISIVNRIITHL